MLVRCFILLYLSFISCGCGENSGSSSHDPLPEKIRATREALEALNGETQAKIETIAQENERLKEEARKLRDAGIGN